MNDPLQQSGPDQPENAPISLPTSASSLPKPVEITNDFDRTLWYTIGGITLVSCCGILLIGYLFTLTGPVQQIFAVPTYPPPSVTMIVPPQPTKPLPTKAPTKSNWVKPAESPALGTASEARLALNDKNVKNLKAYATYMPTIPNVNQPGDVYYYGVRIDSSLRPTLWDYTWCASTAATLADNLAWMEVEFLVNEEPVSAPFIAIQDRQPDERHHCRTFTILVTSWPQAVHKLESKITFIEPTDNGWRLYPIGTHTFLYLVTVRP